MQTRSSVAGAAVVAIAGSAAETVGILGFVPTHPPTYCPGECPPHQTIEL